jgi:hypothetical protein
LYTKVSNVSAVLSIQIEEGIRKELVENLKEK